MDRHFIYHSEKNNGWFCGKCGKRLLPDYYNSKKHAETCGFKVDENLPNQGVVTDDSAGYRLCISKGNLLLEICRPRLIRIQGFTDRYKGMRWVTDLRMVFSPGCKETRVTKNDTGQDADVWLSLIRAGRCFRIREESDIEIIREVFPGIIGLYSPEMFAHIYRTKGFQHVHLMTEQMAQRLMEQYPKANLSESCRTAPDQMEKDREENRAEAVRTRLPSRRRSFPAERPLPMIVSLLKYKNSELILRVTTFTRFGEPVAFLFSRGYAACTPGTDIHYVLQQQYYLTSDADKAVRRFARFYPEYNLEQYMEKSQNILIPLIAPDYHCLLELAAKAVVPSVAENIGILSCYRKHPSLITNLQDTFRIPLHVFRALKPEDVTDELLGALAQINKCHPGLLQFDRYTSAMCDFYQLMTIRMPSEQNDGSGEKRGPLRTYRFFGLYKTDLSDAQVLQILRFLRKSALFPENLHYLFDYINACERLGEYPYGFIPKIPLKTAHDRVVQRIRLDRNELQARVFRSVVSSDIYLSLTTDRTEEDKELFKDDPYVIISPEEIEDLFAESDSMHNCVRIYVTAVCKGTSKIYFLRRKKAPDLSFGTIEVQGNTLRQAKAFGNRKLSNAAQKYIRKWCRAKNLRIRTRDLVDAS